MWACVRLDERVLAPDVRLQVAPLVGGVGALLACPCLGAIVCGHVPPVVEAPGEDPAAAWVLADVLLGGRHF